jgi:intracellular multiplication protein IcmL
MAEEELQIVRLRNDFYRDGFYKIFIALTMMAFAIFLLIAASFSMYLEKPSPVVFYTDTEGRVFSPVPLDQTYISTADLLQWASSVLPKAFSYDFMNYTNQLDSLEQYFTQTGFKKLTDTLATYANPKTVVDSKLFIQATPTAAPTIFNQGLITQGNLAGRYGWWVQMPLDILYSNAEKIYTTPVIIKALVVRISIQNDLSGVAIEDIVISKPVQGGKT